MGGNRRLGVLEIERRENASVYGVPVDMKDGPALLGPMDPGMPSVCRVMGRLTGYDGSSLANAALAERLAPTPVP